MANPADLDPSQLEEEVTDRVSELNATELEELIEELGKTDDVKPDMKGKRGKLRKVIMKYFIEIETDHADNGAAKFLQIYNYLDDKKGTDDKTNITKVEGLGGENESKVDQPGKNSVETKGETPFVKPEYDILRLKELKINGTIGGSEKEKRLSFSGLSYQVMNAKRLGHKEPVIVAAVIRAIAVENNLRTLFEGKVNLTLKSLLRTLHSYYKEKDSDETLNDLSKTVQKPDQNAYDFAVTLMCLRDKYIVLANQEEIQFDKKNLWKRFLKSFSLGLRNSNIRNELRGSLKEQVDDEEFLELVAEATKNETERLEKLGITSPSNVEVKAVSFDPSCNSSGKETGKKDKVNPWVHLEELQLSHQRDMAAQAQLIAALQDQLVANQVQILEIKDVVVGGQRNNPTPLQYPPQQVAPNPPRNPNPPTTPQNLQQAGPRNAPPQNSQNNQPYFQPFSQGHIPYHQRFPMIPPLYSKPPPRKCEACTKDQVPRCYHCWKCGSGDHKIGTCPNA